MSAPHSIYVCVSTAKESFGMHPSTVYRMVGHGEITFH